MFSINKSINDGKPRISQVMKNLDACFECGCCKPCIKDKLIEEFKKQIDRDCK